MKVVKKFGLALHVTFEGSEKAINTFTAIHGAISGRGYGIELPAIDGNHVLSVPGIGRVNLHRFKEDYCEVTFLQGALHSRLSHMFAKS